MLVGRQIERGRIDALLEDACAGGSGALVLRGEPGIGKSTLLGYARERANGMLVLSTRGVESEADLAFAGLHELLQPLLGRIGEIPQPQAAALSAALALGPPTRGDRFAVATGTLSLLSAAAREQPVLVLADDIPWLDSASSEALRFALRRLGDEPIAALLAARAGESTALDGAGLPELVVEGLEPEAARALVPNLAPDVATRLVEATRGNPLALQEIPALLSPEQAAGTAPLPEPLPASTGIIRAFERRIAGLGGEAARALVVAAASQRDDLDTLERALSLRGLDLQVLEAAEHVGVLETGARRLEWRHPLVRSAAYHAASPLERRDAHAALAQALEGSSTGERAWHLAAATAGQDELVAAELERAALDARRRRATAVAARTFERAAELTPEDDMRARRLIEAAHDSRVAGRFEHARSLLDEATRTTRDPLLTVDAALLRGVIEMWSGDVERALAVLVGETEQVELLDPARAATLLMEAALAAQMSGNVASTLALARRAETLAAEAGAAQHQMTADLLLNAEILAGQAPALEVVRKRLRERANDDPEVADAVHYAASVGHVLVWIDEHVLARRVYDRERAAAHRAGSLGVLPFLDATLCELHFRTGRWAAAYAAGLSAVRLAEETEQFSLLSFCQVSLARVEVATGRAEEGRARALHALELAETQGIGSIQAYSLSVLGLLELGLGRASEALGWLERLTPLVEAQGLREPGVIHWRSDLIEALALEGRTDEAVAALAVLDEEGSRTERTWARGTAERCRGMLADGAFELHFQDAVGLLAAFPFERARTELRLGERLRRGRRPVEARKPLGSALAAFERLGAAPWVERARAELAAAGARPPAARPVAPLELTPQELRIARLVAEGGTNREIAAQLYLSPKTVGYHLGKIYAKLGIHSRAQLARLSAAEDGLRLGDPGDVLPSGVVQVGLDDDRRSSSVEGA